MKKLRLRRSMMYVPGISPKMMEKAASLDVDSIILDLEDGVSVDKKKEARECVADALEGIDFGEREVTVRINGLVTGEGTEDIKAIVIKRPDAIVIPKVNTERDIQDVLLLVEEEEKNHGIPGDAIEFMAMIETPLGVIKVNEIAASPRMEALLFGAADFTKETRGKITEGKEELLYAMSRILLGARAAGIDAIDSPYFNVRDEKGLEEDAKRAALLGYDGKTLIHPGQIEIVNRIFSPSKEDVERAGRIIEAFNAAREKGLGVTTLDGELIEALHVRVAERTLEFARRAGLDKD